MRTLIYADETHNDGSVWSRYYEPDIDEMVIMRHKQMQVAVDQLPIVSNKYNDTDRTSGEVIIFA